MKQTVLKITCSIMFMLVFIFYFFVCLLNSNLHRRHYNYTSVLNDERQMYVAVSPR